VRIRGNLTKNLLHNFKNSSYPKNAMSKATLVSRDRVKIGCGG